MPSNNTGAKPFLRFAPRPSY